MLMEDTIRDLMDYEPMRVAQACDAWRRGDNPFFPTSGQLIAKIKDIQEALIPHPGGHARTTYTTTAAERAELNAPARPSLLKPWRQILNEHNRALPAPEAEEPPKPAQQETLLPDGSLTEQRRAELAELAARVAGVALSDEPEQQEMRHG